MKNNLPTIQELYADKAVAKKQDDLIVLLNQEPPAKWVKTHPFIKGYKYLPIDKVEYLLKRIFKAYRIEVIETKMLMNAISVTVRVHYQDPLTNEWHFHDGVGAAELQTAKDSGTLKMDMSNVNSGAVVMALPIAKTVAIKDACDHFGRLFGADLNRKDLINYTPDAKLKPNLEEGTPIFNQILEGLESGTYTLEFVRQQYNTTELERVMSEGGAK